MLFPDRAGLCFAAIPAASPDPRRPGPAFLSFSDSIRSTSCMGSACNPTVQPAACQRASSFAQSITGVFRVASLPSRCANCFSREVQLRGYPASTTRWAPLNRSPLRGFRSLLIAGQYLLRVWVRPRAPFRLPSGNRGVPVSSGPQSLPPPPSTLISAAVYRAS